MTSTPVASSPARGVFDATHRAPETQLLPTLLQLADAGAQQSAIEAQARQLIQTLRRRRPHHLLGELLRAWPLHSTEGRALMGLAECCLRVPDAFTRRLLIRDKLAQGQWRVGMGFAPQLRLMALGLRLGQRLLTGSQPARRRIIEPLVERSALLAMRRLGRQFIFGATIHDALRRARRTRISCSFDMLGEAAHTAQDAQRYYCAYEQAIAAVGRELAAGRSASRQHSISIKLSALHPRYEAQQAARVVPELATRLAALGQLAQQQGVHLCIDAEESDRLELSLHIVEQLLRTPALRGWQGLELAVQAYQKRAPAVIEWLSSLAQSHNCLLGVRLVKGAYWDMEIKRCQERGLEDYPVFTRKAATDASYLACARQLLRSTQLRPAFATHNALSIATLLHWIPSGASVEFQRLHGMAADLYAEVARFSNIPCRVYAPVGAQHELLPYLIRRMLENSSNSGFMQQLGNPDVPVTDLVTQPAQRLHTMQPQPGLPPPGELFGARRNSMGLDLAARTVLDELSRQLESSSPP